MRGYYYEKLELSQVKSTRVKFLIHKEVIDHRLICKQLLGLLGLIKLFGIQIGLLNY